MQITHKFWLIKLSFASCFGLLVFYATKKNRKKIYLTKVKHLTFVHNIIIEFVIRKILVVYRIWKYDFHLLTINFHVHAYHIFSLKSIPIKHTFLRMLTG